MEAAGCGKRAIALSYAFFDRSNKPEAIAAASKKSAQIVEHLAGNWDKEVQLYSINVPLVPEVAGAKVLWTNMLQNAWKSGSCFQEIDIPDGEEDRGADEEEEELRRAESGDGAAAQGEQSNGTKEHLRYKHKHFKWQPRFKDVYESVEQSPSGNDGWAVKEGYVRYDRHLSNCLSVC